MKLEVFDDFPDFPLFAVFAALLIGCGAKTNFRVGVPLEVQIHSFNELPMHAMTQMGFWELCHLRSVKGELQVFRLASN